MTSTYLSIDELVYITAGTIKKKHIIKMEILILRVLSWRLSNPTAHGYIRQLFLLFSQSMDPMLLSDAYFFVELSVFDDSLITEKPSVIAFAAILNALKLKNTVDICNQRGLIEDISATLSINVNEKKLNSTQRKLNEGYYRTEQSKMDDPFINSPTYYEAEEIDNTSTKRVVSSHRSA